MACNCIFLSRHGESEYMLRELLGGDPPLTAKGRAYAQQLPQIILPLLPQDACGRALPVPVLTSTLRRTIQTASCLPFAQQQLRELDEINAGVCEHMTYEQVQHTLPHIHEARARDKLGYRYPQGESYLDLVARLWPVVHQLEQRTSPVVVVAHQAVLRVVVGLLLRKPLQDLPSLAIPLHTVMQLTPTTTTTAAAAAAAAKAAQGSSSSNSYDLQLFPADIIATAPDAMVTQQQLAAKLAEQAAAAPATDGCLVGIKEGYSLHPLAARSSRKTHLGSCSTELHGMRTAASLLPEQQQA